MQSEKKTTIPAKPNLADPVQWVDKYADYLFSYAITRINEEETARDLVQETFLSALECISKFEGKSSEKTWLTAILKYKIIDVYRKKSSGQLKETSVDEAVQEQQDFFNAEDGHWTNAHQPREFHTGNEDPLTQKEFQQVLQKCIQKLPALWSSVFTMKHLDEASTELICDELKVSPANFWVIIHRTKLNLRACLQKNWI